VLLAVRQISLPELAVFRAFNAALFQTVQAYKANSRNAALLEEYLRIRGEEFLKASSHRQEDPEEVRPGAGRGQSEVIPGSSGAGRSVQNIRKGKPVAGVDSAV